MNYYLQPSRFSVRMPTVLSTLEATQAASATCAKCSKHLSVCPCTRPKRHPKPSPCVLETDAQRQASGVRKARKQREKKVPVLQTPEAVPLINLPVDERSDQEMDELMALAFFGSAETVRSPESHFEYAIMTLLDQKPPAEDSAAIVALATELMDTTDALYHPLLPFPATDIEYFLLTEMQ